jgi:hypothetical protein
MSLDDFLEAAASDTLPDTPIVRHLLLLTGAVPASGEHAD